MGLTFFWCWLSCIVPSSMCWIVVCSHTNAVFERMHEQNLLLSAGESAGLCRLRCAELSSVVIRMHLLNVCKNKAYFFLVISQLDCVLVGVRLYLYQCNFRTHARTKLTFSWWWTNVIVPSLGWWSFVGRPASMRIFRFVSTSVIIRLLWTLFTPHRLIINNVCFYKSS
jgi:hypothetical protein